MTCRWQTMCTLQKPEERGRWEDRAWKEQRVQDQKRDGKRQRGHRPVCHAGREYKAQRFRFPEGDSNGFEGPGLHGINKCKVRHRGTSPKGRAMLQEGLQPIFGSMLKNEFPTEFGVSLSAKFTNPFSVLALPKPSGMSQFYTIYIFPNMF